MAEQCPTCGETVITGYAVSKLSGSDLTVEFRHLVECNALQDSTKLQASEAQVSA